VSQSIGAAVLGLGAAAQVHVPGLQSHARFELVGVASSRPGVAAQVAAERKVRRAYESWRDAIADPEVSLVVISSAPSLRAAQLAAALANDKHVLVEPPVADHPRELDALVHEAGRMGHVAAACLTLRYHPARQALRELVVNGHLGEARNAAWRHLSARWNPSIAVHALDVLRWTLGGADRERVQRLEGEQSLALQMRHFDGCLSQLALDGRSATEDLTFTVAGTARVAAVLGDAPDDGELHVFEGETDDEYRLRPSRYQRFSAANRRLPAFLELLDDLAAAIDGKTSAVPTLADAAEAQHLASAL